MLVMDYHSTDEDLSLRIESFAIVNLRGVSTKLNYSIVLYSPCRRTKNLYRSFSFDVTNAMLVHKNKVPQWGRELLCCFNAYTN